MYEHRCPLTYEVMTTEQLYSIEGLKKLSPKLTALKQLPFSPSELRQQAAQRAEKMSIAGVQPKLSAILKISQTQFDIVDTGGQYILKPPLDEYPEVPENEDVTMHLAKLMGIEVPLHGLLYNGDDSFTYFIKRFDRHHRGKKYCLEDFAQLTHATRGIKYQSSMEKVAAVIDTYTTFPAIEKKKLFQRILFCFLTGNEDMHLKNFSLITREKQVMLSPAYDLLNTTILLANVKEETALPIRGRKNNLTSKDLIDYYGRSCLKLTAATTQTVLDELEAQYGSGIDLLERSFLSAEMKERYISLFNNRFERLFS